MTVKQIEITRQMVDDFRTATMDVNKIHEGERAIALGFQMAAMLYDHVRSTLSIPDLDWGSQATRFERPVRTGSSVTLDCDLTGQKSAETFEITAKLIDAKGPVAVSAFTYGPKRPIIKTAPEGNRYEITRAAAQKTAKGIGREGTDVSALVRGLASNALYTDGGGAIETVTGKQGFFPVYIRHEIQQTPTEKELKPGSVVYISTNASAVAERIKSDFGKKKDMGRRIYTTDVKAITIDGLEIYKGRLSLVLMTTEELSKLIA